MALLRRYGVVFWRLLEREAEWLPPWRDLLRVYQRLEALMSLCYLATLWSFLRALDAPKRGWWFAARAVVLHWLYYLYSGATFFLCAVVHFVGVPFESAHNPNKSASRNSSSKPE